MRRFFGGRVPCLAAFFLTAVAVSTPAQDWLTLGARGGDSFNTPAHRFEQAEGFAQFELPWHWAVYSDWRLRPCLDASAGWLNNRQDSAFIGTAGPILELRPGNFPLALEGGSSLTLISRYRFGGMDLGERFQFTTHIGVKWYFTQRLALGFRFQHMSNAGLAAPNPGLNLEMLELSCRF